MKDLKQRCEDFLQELGLPITRFCKNIGITPQSYYRWQKGDMNLKEGREIFIDEYLKKYNF